MKIKKLVFVGATVGGLALAGCGWGGDPCAEVPALTMEESNAATALLEKDERFEVEYAVNENTDCELDDDGTWEQEGEN